jgi:hypothetical protein
MPIKSYNDFFRIGILLGHFLLSEIVSYYYCSLYIYIYIYIYIKSLSLKMLLMITQIISVQIKGLFSDVYSLFATSDLLKTDISAP